MQAWGLGIQGLGKAVGSVRWEGNGFVVLESCLDDGKHVRTVCYASGAQSFSSRRPFDHSSSSAGIPASKSLNFASSPTQRKGSLPVCPETLAQMPRLGMRCGGTRSTRASGIRIFGAWGFLSVWVVGDWMRGSGDRLWSRG